MKKIIISKFGGSSMADEVAMRKAANICVDHKTNIVVLSATFGTTNDLLSLIASAPKGQWDFCANILKNITKRHCELADNLDCNIDTKKCIEKEIRMLTTLVRGIYLLKDCTKKAHDSIVSTGERLSSLIFSDFLNSIHKKNVEYLDVGTLIKTDDNFTKAKPIFSEINKAVAELKLKFKFDKKVYVTQGFIGRTLEGNITTLGRGGSDYSAAIIAEAVDAARVEIWTDVAGISTTDPRICCEASPLSELSFEEAGELATFGAKILHPTTILPAQRKGIDVFVGSTFEPEKPGTWIKKSCKTTPLIRAIALRKNQIMLTLSTPKMLDAHGYLAKVFSIFNRYKISIDLVTTSEISISVSIEKTVLENKKLFKELEELATIKIESNLTSVSLIGNNMNNTPRLASEIFSQLSGNNPLSDSDNDKKAINVRMICMGASHHHFCFLVNQKDGNHAVLRLHQKFLQ